MFNFSRFNFVNAAAMLQGTTNVYGTRVDILHKAVTTFKAEFTKEPAKKKAHKNDQQNGEESGGEEMEMDEEGADKEGHMVDKTKKSRLNRSELEDHSFHASRSRIPGPVELERPNGIKVVVPDRLHHNLTKAVLNENGMIERTEDDGLSIFERFHVDKKSHYPIHISREREYQLMFLMPGSMMPLLSTEKRPVELLGNSGKFGDVDDYRTCRDFVVHNVSILDSFLSLKFYLMYFFSMHCIVILVVLFVIHSPPKLIHVKQSQIKFVNFFKAHKNIIFFP